MIQALNQGLIKTILIRMKLLLLHSPKDWVRLTIQRQNLINYKLFLQIGIEILIPTIRLSHILKGNY